MHLFRRFTWTLILLTSFCLPITSCYWINQPDEEESGSVNLSLEEMSGAEYNYSIFLNDSLQPEKGYGFTILLNNKELLRQTHEIAETELIIYKDKQSAITAAETMIDKLKNDVHQNQTSSTHSTPTQSLE